MPILNDITGCFPSISDWSEVYLDDHRQRLLGEATGFSVEIILGRALDHVGIFSEKEELPEMISVMVMALFLGTRLAGLAVLDRSRDFFSRHPRHAFHAILGTHTLTLFHLKQCTHFRIALSTD